MWPARWLDVCAIACAFRLCTAQDRRRQAENQQSGGGDTQVQACWSPAHTPSTGWG